MKIGDVVQTPHGKGRIVQASVYDLPPTPSRSWKYVFLFYPQHIEERILLFHASEIKKMKG